MKLDPKTIMFTIIIGNLLMSSGLFLIARVYVGRTMGVSRWSRACVIQAMGWIITGALRGVIPDVVSIVLGQTLILLTLLIYMQVLAEFTGQTIRRRWFILPLLVEAIGLTYYSAVQENLVARIAIISLCACLVMCKSIAVLQDKQQKFGTSHRFTAALYMMCAGFMIFRTGYYFVVQPKLGVLPFEQNLINDVSYVVFYIFAVMLTFGFLLMCNERYITEQNIAVQQREEHHALFTKLSEQVPGVIYQYRQFSDGRSCFPFASEGMREIYEVTPAEVKDDASPVLKMIHPKDMALVLASIKDSADTMRAWQAEFRVLLPRQGLRWRRGVAQPEKLSDGSILWHGFITDITEQAIVKEKQHQLEEEVRHSYEALVASELRLRRLMNSSMIGIVQGRPDGQLLEANDVLLHMTGYQRHELDQGQLNWLEITDVDSRLPQENAITQLFQHGNTCQFESNIVSRNGMIIPIMMGLAQLEGGSEEWVGFVLDLREQKRIDHLKSEFISVVSHELRTPLTSIRGSLGLLEAGVCGELPTKALQLIHIAHQNSQRLVGLVNDILDMEKLTSGRMQLNLLPLDMLSLAQQALDANAGYGQSLGVSFVLRGEHAPVLADADRLMQIFANLLSNAAKFSPPGDQIEVRVTPHASDVLVEIEDHGRGIPADFHNQIFGKFAQADATNTRNVGGAGLGLHITKTLIEKMQGEIGFTSEVGVKTIFWFRLPLRKTAPPPPPQ